jgi:hypothetical protein
MSPYVAIGILVGFILFVTIGITYTYKHEKKRFNGGKCPHCGSDLKWEDTDSQGGRLWICPTHYTMKDKSGKPLCPGYSCWISYNQVDRGGLII